MVQKNPGTDVLRGQAYQARYNLKMISSEAKSSLLNMYMMFSSDKVVEISRPEHLPISLLHTCFNVAQSSAARSINDRLKEVRNRFERAFYSLIYFSYRQDFAPLLQRDLEQLEAFLCLDDLHEAQLREIKVGHTNDIGWGCTIRVAQMLTSHAILRHMLDDYNIDKLFREQSSYLKVLELMNDNADGFKGAFSI